MIIKRLKLKYMNEISKNTQGNEANTVLGTGFKILLPLQMEWQPKEDITTYELAMCLPYFFRTQGVMPYEVDTALPHFRHFKITNHNK